MTRLLDCLPAVRGRISADAPLGKNLWFGCGGNAEVLFKPADSDDLQQFLAALPEDIPVTVLGAGSNVLVRDGGIRGVVVRLGRGFTGITVEGETITAAAAALDASVAETALQHGLSGLEFLSGIPGSVGGAVRMNAGCYQREVRDILVSATILTRSGEQHQLDADALGFSYRHSALPADAIVIEAVFKGMPGEANAIATTMADIRQQRQDSQPVRGRTGGSTFTNPPGHKAWQLVDNAGCRGLRLGGAQVSEKHCNFLLNTGDATASELELLGEQVRQRVAQRSGVQLQWEIQRLGSPAA